MARVKTTLADETIVAGDLLPRPVKVMMPMNEIAGADLWIDAAPELIVKARQSLVKLLVFGMSHVSLKMKMTMLNWRVQNLRSKRASRPVLSFS